MGSSYLFFGHSRLERAWQQILEMITVAISHYTQKSSHRITSLHMSPDVYHLVNTMCHFIVSVSYPVNPHVREGKEMVPQTPSLESVLDMDSSLL